MSEWKEYSFSELLSEPVRNGIYKTKEFHGNGQKIVNMGELFANPRLFDVEMKRVELNENDFKKALLKEGDLIFARRSLTAEGAGKCSIVKVINEDTTFESSLIRARPNKSLCNSDFLYYYFSSYQGRNAMYGMMRQVAVAGITGSDLMNLRLEIPPLPEQKAIAHILGSLDEKMELNRKMNQTLEVMAQGLFKSWFVVFDPVIDNALAQGNEIPEELQAQTEKRIEQSDSKKLLTTNPTLAAQFPAAFVFNESLGKWIPEGWRDSILGEIINIQNGFAFKSKDFQDEGIPVLKIKNVKPNKVLYHGIDHVDESLLNLKYIVRKGELLITMTGNRFDGTPNSWVGKVAMFDKDEVYLVNQRVAKITTSSTLTNDFLLELLSSFDFQLYFINNSTSSGGQANISPDLIKNTPVLIPSVSLINEFTRIVEGNRNKIWANSKETETLSQLRDKLLPELISGRVRVPLGMVDS